jgi:hypothetical protein
MRRFDVLETRLVTYWKNDKTSAVATEQAASKCG